jgi:tetratricopeptide (TPR) repeat protein
MSEERTTFIQETESFEAFDLVTEALEYIDSYDAEKKNTEVLREAEASLIKAFEQDKDRPYLKAQYFRAMVCYLKGEPVDALKEFAQIDQVNRESPFGKELSYNIAASHTAAGQWKAAIKKFDEVIKTTQANPKKDMNDDSRLRLLARAGLALSYAGQFERPEDEKQLSPSGKRDEERIKEYSRMIEDQYQLAKDDARKVVDRDTVKESEQILREAYTIVEGRNAERVVELLPVEAPKTKRRTSKRKVIIIVAGIVIFLVLVFIVYVELIVGWDHVFTYSPAT